MVDLVLAGPPRAQPYALLAAAVAVAALGAASDAPGRLLGGACAVVLAALAVRDLVLAPVLEADREGLWVVAGLRRRHLLWSEVTRVRLVRERRTPLLELDTLETVVLLSRWRLGRPAADVVEELLALKP